MSGPPPPLTIGTGKAFPVEFDTDNDYYDPEPEEIFSRVTPYDGCNYDINWRTHEDDEGIVLVHTDGACLGNGQRYPRAGWAFVYGENYYGVPLVVSGRLEEEGPFGEEALQTSNRAELRAVIAALRYRKWHREGFHTLVVATDSEYVVKGATRWVRKWLRNNWVTSSGAWVKNVDLWEALLGEIERYDRKGMAVEFWRIPRELNTVADEAAKDAAEENWKERWSDTYSTY